MFLPWVREAGARGPGLAGGARGRGFTIVREAVIRAAAYTRATDLWQQDQAASQPQAGRPAHPGTQGHSHLQGKSQGRTGQGTS